MLELYHSEPNTFFLKPLIALHEKQARFESRWFDSDALEQFGIGLDGEVEAKLHLEREGPLLRHDGTLVRTRERPEKFPITLGWIPLGRDMTLEQRILCDIQARLLPT